MEAKSEAQAYQIMRKEMKEAVRKRQCHAGLLMKHGRLADDPLVIAATSEVSQITIFLNKHKINDNDT
tara:strand:+ start:1039 stop:1242 length:204 start_codon:yes stop_codon:yes gene_type:complete